MNLKIEGNRRWKTAGRRWIALRSIDLSRDALSHLCHFLRSAKKEVVQRLKQYRILSRLLTRWHSQRKRSTKPPRPKWSNTRISRPSYKLISRELSKKGPPVFSSHFDVRRENRDTAERGVPIFSDFRSSDCDIRSYVYTFLDALKM